MPVSRVVRYSKANGHLRGAVDSDKMFIFGVVRHDHATA